MKCPSCNAGPNDPCAYPTENCKRLLAEINTLKEKLVEAENTILELRWAMRFVHD